MPSGLTILNIKQMKKKEQIDNFLEKLKSQNPQDLKWDIEGDVGDILEHFAISCKKCGSVKIFVSWRQGKIYGRYTGYSEGQKVFLCVDCLNSASFWE